MECFRFIMLLVLLFTIVCYVAIIISDYGLLFCYFVVVTGVMEQSQGSDEQLCGNGANSTYYSGHTRI